MLLQRGEGHDSKGKSVGVRKGGGSKKVVQSARRRQREGGGKKRGIPKN